MTLTDAPFTAAGVPMTEGAGSVPWPLVALVHLQAGILILDATGKVVFVNEWFLKRCGMAADVAGRAQADRGVRQPCHCQFCP
jgi:hypothetical protein